MTVMRLVAGSGRSGTTWVQDALATANNLRPVFEPLHPYVSKIGNRYAHRALTPDDDHPELAEFLNEVCAGRRNRLWTQYRRQLRWLLPPPEEFWTIHDAGLVYRRWGKFLKELPRLTMAGRRGDPLIKCIRANLMLGWLTRRCECRTVLVVRHPGAVIESELRGGWNPQFALDRFRRDSTLHEITSNRYRQLLDRHLTPVEALAVRWVIENQWVIEHATENGVTVVFYEHLKSAPDREWERIRVCLDLQHVPEPELVAQPSQQSSPKRSSATSAASDAPRWLRVLSSEQRTIVQRVLDLAEVGLYSMSCAEPLPSNSVASARLSARLQP